MSISSQTSNNIRIKSKNEHKNNRFSNMQNKIHKRRESFNTKSDLTYSDYDNNNKEKNDRIKYRDKYDEREKNDSYTLSYISDKQNKNKDGYDDYSENHYKSKNQNNDNHKYSKYDRYYNKQDYNNRDRRGRFNRYSKYDRKDKYKDNSYSLDKKKKFSGDYDKYNKNNNNNKYSNYNKYDRHNKHRNRSRRSHSSSRSNSALRVMRLKNLQNGKRQIKSNQYSRNSNNKVELKAPKMYWDGYQWITKLVNEDKSKDNNVNFNEKKVQISNVPLHLELDKKLFKQFLVDKMIERNVTSLKSHSLVSSLIVSLDFFPEKNVVILTLKSNEIANFCLLLDGIVCLGCTLRVGLYKSGEENKRDNNNRSNKSENNNTNNKNEADSICKNSVESSDKNSCGNDNKKEEKDNKMDFQILVRESALADSAKIAAKSAAISYAAYESIKRMEKENNRNRNSNNNTKNDNKVFLNVFNGDENIDINQVPSRVIKIMGLNPSNIAQIYPSISIFDKPKKILLVSENRLGASVGDVFVVFKDIEPAKKLYIYACSEGLCGKKVRAAFIDQEAFEKDICREKDNDMENDVNSY